MKVKIFANMYMSTLEENINKFLEGKSIKVKDIKYSITSDVENNEILSALIMYEEKEE